MSIESKLLAKLKEQEAAIKERIKEAKKQEAKKQAALHQKKSTIIGAAILAEIEDNQTLKATLDPIINKRITAAGDRKTLGLDPLPKKKNEKNPASAGITTG